MDNEERIRKLVDIFSNRLTAHEYLTWMVFRLLKAQGLDVNGELKTTLAVASEGDSDLSAEIASVAKRMLKLLGEENSDA